MDNQDIRYSEYSNKLSLNNRIGRLIWNITYVFLFRPFPTKLFRIWHVQILKIFGAKIGKNCTFNNKAKLWAPWNLIMESNSLIDSNCNIYNPGIVHLMSQTVVSFNVTIITASHDFQSLKHELIIKPVLIEEYVWIASEAYIGPGVKIGQGAVIGARSVVVKNVDPWTVVGGNPAKYIKKRELQNA